MKFLEEKNETGMRKAEGEGVRREKRKRESGGRERSCTHDRVYNVLFLYFEIQSFRAELNYRMLLQFP